MKHSEKVVTALPLANLWTNETDLRAERVTYLSRDDIALLLKESLIQFIVSDLGHKLNWIDSNQCYNFWKTERQHVADNPEKIHLNDFVNNYAYIASRWTGQEKIPIVLLEKVH